MSDYLLGTDLLCETEVVGSSTSWDNSCSYNAGDYVYYGGEYYRALRQISAPWFPILQSGEVPGQSDAWRKVTAQEAGEVMSPEIAHRVLGEVAGWDSGFDATFRAIWEPQGRWDQNAQQLHPNAIAKTTQIYRGTASQSARDALASAQARQAAAEKALSDWRAAQLAQYSSSTSPYATPQTYDVLGVHLSDGALYDAEIVGEAFDINVKQRQMNELKQVPVSVARALLDGGQKAIDYARDLAQSHDLPLGTSRDQVYWKLKWHEDTLGKITSSPAQIYSSGDDLKHWVMQAFIEANAAEEGAKTVDAMTIPQMWADMWTVVGKELAKLPQALRDAAGNVIKDVTGIPVWGWFLLGLGSLATLGLIAYVIINSKAGAAAAGVAARRYLP